MHPKMPLRLLMSEEVKWNLSEVEVPMVEHLVREDAIEIQDVRELGMGWTLFVSDLRCFYLRGSTWRLVTQLQRSLSTKYTSGLNCPACFGPNFWMTSCGLVVGGLTNQISGKRPASPHQLDLDQLLRDAILWLKLACWSFTRKEASPLFLAW